MIEWQNGGIPVKYDAGIVSYELRWTVPSGYSQKKRVLLLSGKRKATTHSYWLLSEAAKPQGVAVTERQKGFSNHGDIKRLENLGLLETGKAVGPRGGVRWSLTDKGKAVLVDCDVTRA